MNRLRWMMVVTVVGLVQAASLQAAHLKSDIWGFKWGSSVSSLGKFQKSASKGPVDYYIRPDTIYVIDDFEFSDVVYGFHQDRLFAVYVHIDNIAMFTRVKSYIQSKYGIPKMVFSRQGELADVYRWKDPPIKIKMKSNSGNGKMKVAFYYIPISKQVNESEQEAFEEEQIRFLPIEKDSQYDRVPLLTF